MRQRPVPDATLPSNTRKPRAGMTEYQAVIVRMQGRAREDEDQVTDLLNERARMGWEYHSATKLGDDKLLVVFHRKA